MAYRKKNYVAIIWSRPKKFDFLVLDVYEDEVLLISFFRLQRVTTVSMWEKEREKVVKDYQQK